MAKKYENKFKKDTGAHKSSQHVVQLDRKLFYSM